jgi:hypothetical protein
VTTRQRAGSALLEVIAAFTILTISGVSGASLLAHLSHTVAVAEHADRETAAAAQLVARVSMWPRDRLEGAVGEQPVGGFLLIVRPLTSTLYEVQVLAPLHRSQILTTVLHREQPLESHG